MNCITRSKETSYISLYGWATYDKPNILVLISSIEVRKVKFLLGDINARRLYCDVDYDLSFFKIRHLGFEYMKDPVCGELILEVEDNGCGMDKDTISRIFDLFFTTKEEVMGAGLGLYIPQNLLESIGGSISVKSEIGLGTTFRVMIPDLIAADLKTV